MVGAVEARSTYSCAHCGRSYEGRGVYADHGLAAYNLARHEGACIAQQQRRARVEARKAARKARKYRRHLERVTGRHGGVAPMEGQLGFPFDGVPAIVA